MLTQKSPATEVTMLGQELSHYRITGRLGAGGMGIVWKAIDITLGREVALKLLPADHASDAARVNRFLKEARSASALNHPNIITIYEANTAGSVPFIAMEYVRGQTLRDVLMREPLAITKCVEIGIQLCAALQHAHEAGIIHRDLKPGNIMFCLDGTAKVLDFGLAKQVAPPSEPVGNSADFTVTTEGAAMGTIRYMSPEQALGEDIDARSDLFSLGVVLYEMLSGTRPFDGSSNVATLRRILSLDPEPLHTLVPGIPPELEAVVMRSLEKQRENRYASAAEICAGLRGVQALYERVASEPTETLYRVSGKRYGLRRRASLIVLAGTVIVGLAFGIKAVPQWIRASWATVNLEAESSSNEHDAYRAARRYLDRYDRKGNIERAINALETAKRLNPNYALAYAGLSEAYLRRASGSPDPQAQRAIRESAEKAVQLNPDLAAAHTALGMALAASRENSDRLSAAGEFRKALELDPKSSHAYIGLAKAAAETGDRPGAEAAFAKSIELASGEWLPLSEYARFLFRSARYEEAAENWERALAAAPDNVRVLSALGAAYHMLDRYDDAASAFQRALEIEPSAQVYTNLGTNRFFGGHYAAAAEAMQKALDMKPDSRAVFWGNLGDAYRWAPGQRARSLDVYRHAIELVRQEIKTAPNDSELQASLAVYLAKSGDLAGAARELDRLGKLPQLTANANFQASLAYELLGNRALALRSLETAVTQGHPLSEVRNEPELVALREDPGFRTISDRFTGTGSVQPARP